MDSTLEDRNNQTHRGKINLTSYIWPGEIYVYINA